MIEYGIKHIDDIPKVDYFAVSLPNFLIFEEDLVKSNHVHCLYLQGIGNLGKGNNQKAISIFKEAKEKNLNHMGLNSIFNLMI